MDIDMPVMDGYQTTSQIRKFLGAKADTDSKEIKMPWIVACTAKNSQDERDQCLRAGMNCFMTKPPPPGEIERILSNIFGRGRLNFGIEEE